MKAELSKLREEKFREFREGEMFKIDDLSLNLWVTMADHLTPRQIAALPDSLTGMEAEIGEELFWIATSPGAPNREQSELLLSLARALLDETYSWKLSLGYYRRGKPLSAITTAQIYERTRQIGEAIELLTLDGIKLEAAVAEVCETFEISRATAFRAWRVRDKLRVSDGDADRIVPVLEANNLEAINPTLRPGPVSKIYSLFRRWFA